MQHWTIWHLLKWLYWWVIVFLSLCSYVHNTNILCEINRQIQERSKKKESIGVRCRKIFIHIIFSNLGWRDFLQPVVKEETEYLGDKVIKVDVHEIGDSDLREQFFHILDNRPHAITQPNSPFEGLGMYQMIKTSL